MRWQRMSRFEYFIRYQTNKSTHWKRHETNEYAQYPMHHVKRHCLERRTTELHNQNLAKDGNQKNPNEELVFGDAFENVELIVDASAAKLTRDQYSNPHMHHCLCTYLISLKN